MKSCLANVHMCLLLCNYFYKFYLCYIADVNFYLLRRLLVKKVLQYVGNSLYWNAVHHFDILSCDFNYVHLWPVADV